MLIACRSEHTSSLIRWGVCRARVTTTRTTAGKGCVRVRASEHDRQHASFSSHFHSRTTNRASPLCVEPNPERAVVEVASLPRLGRRLLAPERNVAESADEMRDGRQPRLLVVHDLLARLRP